VKRRKPVRGKRASPSPSAQEDLNATSRAFDEVGEVREPKAAAQDNESIEDPLQDWPESAGDADQWLKERRARDEQRDG